MLVQSPIKLQIDLRGVKMENITFYEQINLFLEKKKRPRKPLAYVHRQGPTYISLMHAYAGTKLCTQLGFQKPMKDNFFALKTKVWN